MKFYNIADAGQPQAMADYPHAAHNQKITALFTKRIIMAAFVQQMTFDRAQVFGPLLLQMDQRPLPPAEAEMLDARHHQVIVSVHQANLSQVTPSGRLSSTQTL